jgi:ectoine hydroxylase-related dioxygenase (phytanoyl-CoA dioxygenase family)
VAAATMDRQGLSAADRAAAEALRRDGVVVVRDLLTPEELVAARRDQETANRDAFHGLIPVRPRTAIDPEQPATNTPLGGLYMGTLPGLARCYSHPRIVAIVRAAMRAEPFLHLLKINRFTAGHPGLGPHHDSVGTEFLEPWRRVAAMVFLDDIGEDSGAFEYVPTSHRLSFRDDERQPDQGIAGRGSSPPTKGPGSELETVHAAGLYLPLTLSAGSVVFRHSAVWHAVRPISRLRRYATALFTPERPTQTAEDAEIYASLPAELQRLCRPASVGVDSASRL